MDNSQKSIADLQKTVSETTVAPEKQQALDDLSHHIDEYQADPDGQHLSFRDRLERSLVEFGADHPKLNDALQVVLSDLSNAGV